MTQEPKEIGEMYEKVKPYVAEMKSRYPYPEHFEGLEPALTSDIAEIVTRLLNQERGEVVAQIEKLAAYESYRAEGDLDPLISKRDVLALLRNRGI